MDRTIVLPTKLSLNLRRKVRNLTKRRYRDIYRDTAHNNQPASNVTNLLYIHICTRPLKTAGEIYFICTTINNGYLIA